MQNLERASEGKNKIDLIMVVIMKMTHLQENLHFIIELISLGPKWCKSHSGHFAPVSDVESKSVISGSWFLVESASDIAVGFRTIMAKKLV